MTDIKREYLRRLSSPSVLSGLGLALIGAVLFTLFSVQYRESGGSLHFVWIPLVVSGGLGLAGCSWLRIEFAQTGMPQCFACGYDLRGIPEGSICPECGHALARPSRVSRFSFPRFLTLAPGYLMLMLTLVSMLFSAAYLSLFRGGALGGV